MTTTLLFLLAVATPPSGVAEAERLAAHAVTLAAPACAVEARKALSLTEEFEPTVFVNAGRKGEVVEDAYVVAREEYRRHRARLYDAVGECALKAGEAVAAVHYLNRAALLDPSGGSLPHLSAALLATGAGKASLDLLSRPQTHLNPSDVVAAADAAEVPSAQAELDRIRLLAAGATFRDGPFEAPLGVQLSTGGPLSLREPGTVTLLYEAEENCKSCSQDLVALKGAVRPGTRAVLIPEVSTRDGALREILNVYHLSFPLLVGSGASQAFHLKGRSLLIVARGGWSAAELKPPFSQLDAAIKIFLTNDIQETVPRPAWNHRPVDRTPPQAPPSLLPEGLAPGEDAPFPEGFQKAVEAYKAGRAQEASALIEAAAARKDGWLLPPEARLDHALCLAAQGQKEAARRILLKIGDSRFQDAVDHALEAASSHN